MPCDPWYTTLEASAKFVISAISGRFDSSGVSKTYDFGYFWPVSWVITHDFWIPGRFGCLVPLVHDSSGVGKTRDFGHFCPFLWVITNDFQIPENFDAL